MILDRRGGILMSTGSFPEILSQAILVGIVLVGRLGVAHARRLQGEDDLVCVDVRQWDGAHLREGQHSLSVIHFLRTSLPFGHTSKVAVRWA